MIHQVKNRFTPAVVVIVIFGIGEFLGYALRLLAGVLSDKNGRHWVFMFVGYGMLIVVPLMGLTMNWPILVVLIWMERIGKALRNPAKDTVLSSVAENQVGVGFAFGLQEALDQIGAFPYLCISEDSAGSLAAYGRAKRRT